MAFVITVIGALAEDFNWPLHLSIQITEWGSVMCS